MNEALWRQAERDQVRRERLRRIRLGMIVPAHYGVPTVLARDSDGKWWPNRNFVG